MMKRCLALSGLLVATALLGGCATDKMHRDGLIQVDRGNYEVGLAELTEAARRDPQNIAYRLDLAALRQAAVERLVSAADNARSAGQFDLAAGTYRRVLVIDPDNSHAQDGITRADADRRHTLTVVEAVKLFQNKDYDAAESTLHAVLKEDPGFIPATDLMAQVLAARGPLTVAPQLKSRSNGKVTLQFRDAPTKMVFEVLGRQTGINFILDKDVKSDGKTTIFVHDIPIEEALDLIIEQNELAREVLSSNTVLIFPNTPSKLKDYQEQIVHTFYLTNAAPKDVESLLKSMLDAKNLYIDERTNVVVMRDSPDTIRMAEKLVASIDVAEPEVLISVEVLEIARSNIVNLGVGYPSSVTLTPQPLAAASAAAAATASTGLTLADLRNQNSSTVGISGLSATINANQQRTDADTLASPRIRARNKEKAKILIGSRVPVITNSVTPTTTSAVVTGSVQYLDVGLTLEVQPTVYLNGDVSIKLGLEVSSIINQITTSSGTIAYTIGTRNATTLLQLKDGETQLLGGLIQDSDTRGANGIPGFSQIPVIGRLFGVRSGDREKSEIVLSITPHIIRAQARAPADSQEFWYGTETRTRTAPFRESDSGSEGATQSAANNSAGTGPVPNAGGGAAGGAPPDLNGPIPRPTVTMLAPTETSVGHEFDLTVHIDSEAGIPHLLGQVRFDPTAVQLVSAAAGAIVPASAGSPTVDAKGGEAKLDVSAPEEPVHGQGNLMVLHFKALAPNAGSIIGAMVSVIGPNGASIANAASEPLKLLIKP